MRKIKFLLVAVFALVGMSAFAQDAPKKSDLATDGNTVQYLYNVGKKAFFIGANNWGTRASYNPEKGYKFKVKDNGNGTFSLIDYPEDKGQWMGCFWDGSGVYVDNNSNENRLKWKVIIAEDGTFKIQHPDAGAGYLGVGATQGDDDTRLYFYEGDEDFVTWYAVSEEDYEEYFGIYAEYIDHNPEAAYTSVEDLKGKTFAIINEDEGKALCFMENQVLNYELIETALGTAKGNLFKIEAAQGDGVEGYYYIHTCKIDGSDYTSPWGGYYLNSQPANESVCFVLTNGANGHTNGQDIDNGAVWDIQYVAEKGFTLKNIGTGKYLGTTGPANFDDPVYWSFEPVTKPYQFGPSVLNAYNKALEDAKAVDLSQTMPSDVRQALVDALDTYAYDNVINSSATKESVKAAIEALEDAVAPAATFAEYRAAYKAAQDVDLTQKMNATTKSDFEAALVTYADDKVITETAKLESIQAATEELNKQIAAVDASVKVYAATAKAIETYGTKAAALDADGQAAYDVAAIQAAYNEGTFAEDKSADVAAAFRKAVKAQTTAGADMTGAIINPSFEDEPKGTGWTMQAGNQNLRGGAETNYCAESWHSTFTLSQKLEGMPKGKYTLTAQGFYNQDGSDNDHLPVFYANSETATFKPGSHSESSMGMASAQFTAGEYTCDPIEFVIGEDGVITIGAKLETNTTLWCCWDNFKLTYTDPTAEPVYVFPEAYSKVYIYNEASGMFVKADATTAYKADVTEADIYTVWCKGTETPDGKNLRIAAGKNDATGKWRSLRVNADGDIVFQDEDYSKWKLVKDEESGFYKLQNTYTTAGQSNNPGFMAVNLEDGKVEIVAEANEYALWQFLSQEDFDAIPTAIKAIAEKSAASKAIFNVAGQQVKSLQKGLNIVDGKKVYVK